jgi:hypothetical protein
MVESINELDRGDFHNKRTGPSLVYSSKQAHRLGKRYLMYQNHNIIDTGRSFVQGQFQQITTDGKNL